MQLSSFRVRMFRNVIDSGEIEVKRDVTCLVGKNESGKTALLHALYRLHPAHGEQFMMDDHYPRWRLAQDRRTDAAENATPIEATYALDDDDVAAVAEVFGDGVVKPGAKLTLSRRYGSDTLYVVLRPDEAKIVQNLVRASALPSKERRPFGKCPTVAGLRSAIEEAQAQRSTADADVDDPVSGQLAALDQAAADLVGDAKTIGVAVWQKALKARWPQFFYFSDYSTLPGRVNLDELAGVESGTPASSGLQTARALLELATTEMTALRDPNYELRRAELETVSNDLTRQVFEYWKQNPDLEVTIDVDMATVNQPSGQTAVARFLDVRVRDRRHGYTNNFSQRSSGFQWFFSFLAAFSEFEAYDTPVVVLLDEPALTLHGRAQLDFLRFIEERLAVDHQVIYTTHSPFMVETGKLERARIVEDRGPEDGVVVSAEVLASDPDSLFPLQAALGYDIAQSLFVGQDNLIVEGTSDFTYLTVMSEFLRQQGRGHLDPRWRPVPVGGAQNVPTFVALLGGHLDVTVLVDSGATGMQRIYDIVNRGLLATSQLILVSEITKTKHADIEDLFDPDDYVSLYNASLHQTLGGAELDPGDRIIERIERKSGKFEHGDPADHLLRSRDTILPTLKEETWKRFEALFERINQELSPAL